MKKHFKTTGRYSRLDFRKFQIVWYFALILFALISGFALKSAAHIPVIGEIFIASISFIIFLAFMVSQVATQIKRWHDRNKTGWWVLITFLPIIGLFWALIELGLLKGTPGPNNYGSDPGEITSEDMTSPNTEL